MNLKVSGPGVTSRVGARNRLHIELTNLVYASFMRKPLATSRQRDTTIQRIAQFSWAMALFFSLSGHVFAKPTLPEGMYRVDWNRHVSDLCVDFFTNEDFSAKDWQGVLGAQGPICSLRDVREGKTEASWVGQCNQPWVGRVIEVEHRVRVKVNKDGSFDIQTMLSGGLQATIPIRGVPIKGAEGRILKCEAGAKMFRPWN
jgi:hypothetical protein